MAQSENTGIAQGVVVAVAAVALTAGAAMVWMNAQDLAGSEPLYINSEPH